MTRRVWGVVVLALFFIMSLNPVSLASAPTLAGFIPWGKDAVPFEDVSKPWIITFNAPVLSTDVTGTNQNNIFITYDNNNKVMINTDLLPDGQAVKVTPLSPYMAGAEYRLYITDQIHDVNGNKNRQAIVMPFKPSIKTEQLRGRVEINHSGEIEKKDKEVILTKPDTPVSTGNMRTMQSISPDCIFCPDFEYNIRYIARIMPVEVDGITVQANDLVIDQDRAFVAYNAQGPAFAGAIQIIDISDAENPRVLQELKFSGMDINAVYFDKDTNQLLFGGGADPSTFGFSSFIARVEVGNINVDDIAHTYTALPSNCVTSITKSGNKYYVGAGASNGAIVCLDGNLHNVKSRDVADVRDVVGYGKHFAALAGHYTNTSPETTGRIIRSLDDSSKDIVVTPFDSPEAKATIDVCTADICGHILFDEDGLAFLALSREGFKIFKMGGIINKDKEIYSLDNPPSPPEKQDYNTNSASYDGGLIFLANGDYGFRVLRINGLSLIDNLTGELGLMPGQFAEIVGYHQLSGSIYDGQNYYANHIAYKKRIIKPNHRPMEQNLLFVASGASGVNVYTLTRKDDFDYTPIPADTLNGINQILVEGQGQDMNSPIITADSNLKLTANAQVTAVFVNEEAAYQNAVGFFTFAGDPAITDPAQIENSQQILFKNASKQNSGGTLVPGDSVLMGNFTAGQNIGMYFRQDGYKKPGGPQYYTIPGLNDDSQRHYAIFVDEANQKIVLALEDLTNLGDKDFNDVVMILDVKPFSAVDTSQLPKINELLNK